MRQGDSMPRPRTSKLRRTVRAFHPDRRLQRAIIETLEVRQLLTTTAASAPQAISNNNALPESLVVNPAVASVVVSFVVSAPGTAIAGSAFNFTVTAQTGGGRRP